MATTCTICRSPRREEIDARLAAGGRNNSLRRIAADLGFGLRTVWNHSRHARERDANASSDTTSADRELLRHWRALHKKSMRDGSLDTAARCLQSIAELQARMAAPPRESGFTSPARRAGEGFAIRLVFDDTDPKNPESSRTRRVDEEEFLDFYLRRHSWRTVLTGTLEAMLTDAHTPERVRQGAREFLNILIQEDTNDDLGTTALIGEESETSDGEEGDSGSAS